MAAKILIINGICYYFMLTLLKDRVINGRFMTKDRVMKGRFMTKDRVIMGAFYDKRQSYNGVFVTDSQSKQSETEERGIVSWISFLLWALKLSQDDNI